MFYFIIFLKKFFSSFYIIFFNLHNLFLNVILKNDEKNDHVLQG